MLTVLDKNALNFSPVSSEICFDSIKYLLRATPEKLHVTTPRMSSRSVQKELKKRVEKNLSKTPNYIKFHKNPVGESRVFFTCGLIWHN
jgi:hypothetical protein